MHLFISQAIRNPSISLNENEKVFGILKTDGQESEKEGITD